MKKIKMLIDGMHCASCAGNIERSLRSVRGVHEVSVSVMTKKAIVQSEVSISEEELRKAVSKAGYKVMAVETQ